MKFHDLHKIRKESGRGRPLVFIFRYLLPALVLAASVVSLFPKAAAAHEVDGTIKIGVLSNRGKDEAVRMWSATARYLAGKIPGYSFEIVPLDFDEIGPAVKSGDVDFVIANTSIYIELEALYGVTHMVTMRQKSRWGSFTVFGSVIFCRANRGDIRELRDLRGKTFMGVQENSLGGWQMAWAEMKHQKINPFRYLRNLRFGGTQDAVVYAVRDGVVDAGTVRTGMLERMAADGLIDLKKFRILNPRQEAGFPFLLSTPLYPEWPFARVKHISDDLARRVAIVLLSMPEDAEAAREAKIAGWTVAVDYASVDDLLNELKVGPYKDYGKVTWSDILRQYWPYLLFSAGLLVLLAVFAFHALKLNRHLTRSNENLEKAHREIAQTNSELMAEVAERKRMEGALGESEKKYRSIVDSSIDAIYASDREGRFTMINCAGARILGHASPAELLGQPVSEYWRSNADREAFVKILREQKEVRNYPIKARKIDGGPVEIEATSRVIEDDDGTFLGIEGILRDVTLRREAEEELRKNHETLQHLFNQVELIKKEWEISLDCTDDMILLADAEGRIRRCNRAVSLFAGKGYDEIAGLDWAELMNENGLINDQMTDGIFVRKVELFHEPSGRWFMLSSYPFENEKMGITGQVLTLHDFTEMKNITEALEITNLEIDKNRVKLQSALDELTFLLQQVSQKKDFSVRFANPQLSRCYEVTRCGKTYCPCYGKDGVRCWQIAGTFCDKKATGTFAEKFGNCGECAVFQKATSDPVYQIGENFNNMMHILEQQHSELEKAYNELKLAQSQILQQEKMASIGQLAAGVAHEINNPTGYIMSNLGSLKRYMERIGEFLKVQDDAMKGLPAEEQARVCARRKELKVDMIMEDMGNLAKESLDGAERIKKIVQDLKGFSRVDEAEQKMADINAGLESTLNIVWNELKYKAVLKKEFGDIPDTKCNLGQLNQVFMNILVNAAHAIEKQGEIGIRTWFEEGQIHVRISDTGSGIPADSIGRIFEPFYTTKEVGKGTGLGLSIAYDIVKKHRGEILVESEVGRGTAFTVKIPVVEDI
ncbi:MAG: PhnD/SsuA/transferrin family substrate-binding protein [Nitrospiraceae bacterium]|nr:PhnD/SsuA/transferrin family substrate-binding protein [Nitrospiraceae bacterium]